MDNRTISSIVAVAVVCGVIGYWGGSTFGGQSLSRTPGQIGSQAGQQSGNRTRFGGSGAAFGVITSKDADSITVALDNKTSASSANGGMNGSKIVLYSDTTEVSKMVTGSISDLAVGTQVVVNGTANADGSISASMIQIRPAGTGGPGSPSGVRPQQ